MRNQKTKTFLGLAAAALVALTMATTFDGAAEAGSPAAAKKIQMQQKPPVPPRPTGPQAAGKIQSKPVVIGDHAWVQFYDVKTGEDTGCHDIDNQTSCAGTCPCN